MKFTGDNNEMDIHKDDLSPIKTQTLSIIYTICEDDCNYGSIKLSNKNNGQIMKYKYNIKTVTNNTYIHTAYDNSIYCFLGSFSEHGVLPIKKGYRISFVLFYNTFYTYYDALIIWNKHLLDDNYKILCIHCANVFKHKNSYNNHCNKFNLIK